VFQLEALSQNTSISKQELMMLQNLKASLLSMHLNGGKPDQSMLSNLSGFSQADIFKAYQE
jgi:hypothetical protein